MPDTDVDEAINALAVYWWGRVVSDNAQELAREAVEALRAAGFTIVAPERAEHK
ncbi:MAG TPA: hypothetical protein VLL25_18545 [Acidimicrobiales bacterium]|nr:hypothetical protein [Acidimicrobiales bacterium]